MLRDAFEQRSRGLGWCLRRNMKVTGGRCILSSPTPHITHLGNRGLHICAVSIGGRARDSLVMWIGRGFAPHPFYPVVYPLPRLCMVPMYMLAHRMTSMFASATFPHNILYACMYYARLYLA